VTLVDALHVRAEERRRTLAALHAVLLALELARAEALDVVDAVERGRAVARGHALLAARAEAAYERRVAVAVELALLAERLTSGRLTSAARREQRRQRRRADACTFAAADVLFSYRRASRTNDGDYGRQISAIVLT